MAAGYEPIQQVSPEVPSGYFVGRWVAAGWEYDTVLDCSKMSVEAGSLKGEVKYTVLKAGWGGPGLVGETGIEYMTGIYDPETRIYKGCGTSVTNEKILGISPKYEFRFVRGRVIGTFGMTEVDLWERVEAGKELTIQREIMRIKKLVGFFRFVFEDAVQGGLQIAFVVEAVTQKGWLDPNVIFTIVSVAAGLLVSLGGPLNEYMKERRIQKEMDAANVEELQIKVPNSIDDESADTAKKSNDVDSANAAKKTQESTPTQTSNSSQDDLNAHGDMRIKDVSVLQVLNQNRRLYNVLTAASLMYWMAMLAVPFAFDNQMTCKARVPMKAHLLFVATFLVVEVVELWIALHTAKGYRFLTGYPGQFLMNVGLSALAKFDAYSDITFVKMASECKSWVAMPALVLLLFGVVALQAIPAVMLLLTRSRIMVALKLNDLNILMQLVFAKTSAEADQ